MVIFSFVNMCWSCSGGAGNRESFLVWQHIWIWIQERTITEEVGLVVSSVKSSEQYKDMRSYADTCHSWLEALVAMAPDSVHSSFVPKTGDPEEPLSPSSKLLRSQFFATSSPNADLLSKYETNLRSKLTDVVTVRKKLDKMLQRQCALASTSDWVSTIKKQHVRLSKHIFRLADLPLYNLHCVFSSFFSNHYICCFPMSVQGKRSVFKKN